MPEEKEANPQDRQKCHTECEFVAKVIVDAQVPVGRRRNGFASQAQADRKEKDGKKDEAQLDDAEGRGGDELVETAGSMWSEMKDVGDSSKADLDRHQLLLPVVRGKRADIMALGEMLVSISVEDNTHLHHWYDFSMAG
ncbi:MAG: hypothetical protein LQ337_005904 [Flavoplaca oasis]|nr:MAG: hypothetical protein LQ337_005904 [Flavoplaca oasis]